MSGRRVKLGELAERSEPTAAPDPPPAPAPDPVPEANVAAAVATQAPPAGTSPDPPPAQGGRSAPAPEPAAAPPGSADTLSDDGSGSSAETPPSAPPTSSTGRARNRRKPASPVHYTELVAKEARIRHDQYGTLTMMSRDLNRNRAGRGTRITENTLIRVAIDLLIEHEPQLRGAADEAELRASLGL